MEKLKAHIITVKGIVQSVGFRPTVFRLFRKYTGWVKNTKDGVKIYLEGNLDSDKIKKAITINKPPNSSIQTIEIKTFKIRKRAFREFSIKKTTDITGEVFIPPDLGICDECEKELLDTANRRYLHPFINCTNCGPRYSIITGAPYDRSKTTMKHFPMCKKCKSEFLDPNSRRFHAQPICCNSCGPTYFLLKNKKIVAKGIEAVELLAKLLEDGKVVLVKGIGGYHLMCDAQNTQAIEMIKTIKHRERKPFAVIAKDLQTAKEELIIGETEEKILKGQIKPIVFLKPRNSGFLKDTRMNSPYLGVMLPYAPLHILIFHFTSLRFIVATSANETEKPLIYLDKDAVKFSIDNGINVLTNNRKIVRPLEDSIVHVVNGKQIIFRYARGFAPGFILKKTKNKILATGADMKNNIALALGDRIIISQYTGDLSEFDNYLRFKEKVSDMLSFFNFKPEIVACDMHPEYFSSEFAKESFSKIKQVQHHKAHMLSVIFENDIEKPVIGIILDGTGYGEDGNIWGGEFFVKINKTIERGGHIAYMPFAFGDLAIKEPYRLAALWLYETIGEKAFNYEVFTFNPKIKQAVKVKTTLKTSSAGRWFDVVSALLGITLKSTYEAEAAINLMYEAFKSDTKALFDYSVKSGNIDLKPVIEQIIQSTNNKAEIARAFHNTFIDAIFKNTLDLSRQTGIKTVVLSGGVFQNEIILKGTMEKLTRAGIDVFVNTKVPINDGGIALGQIYAAEFGID